MASPEALTPQYIRLVDASLNRVAEGLRYLEDISRFLLNDIAISRRLKSLRHVIISTDWRFQKQLLDARNAAGDIGVGLKLPDIEEKKRDFMSSIVANARRVQEGLRTLEEISKVSPFLNHLSFQKLEQARFDMYTIEKELISRLLRKEKASRIYGLYVIIDSQSLGKHSYVDITLQAIRGGAHIIQLRDKNLDHGELLPVAQEMKSLCTENDVLFIINDYLDLALAVHADGLHVGQTDMPVSIIRKFLPMDMLIGCSVDNITQAKKAQAQGADYVATGAIFPTASKKTGVVGLNTLKKVKKSVSLPVVAIGGITIKNIAEVRAAGADAASVISAVSNAPSPEKSVKQLIKKFEAENG